MPPPEFLEGKYDVVAKIREGGMGAVYKVRHRLLKELRVVKVMHPQVASSAEQRKRFVREAQTATRLKHPNIVTFYDFAVDPDGTAYMVMEYIDGTDLADLVRRLGPMPVPIALTLLRQCLSALAYLHKRGIVHRDVSPDNILLSRDEDGALQTKLIDLGIAKVARDEENLTAADEFLGKLRYASPEQLTGPTDGPIDGRSDLYSLGAAIYEVLTGVCPFRGKSLQSILAAHLTGSPVPFSESDPKEQVPMGLRRALIRALEILPAERFQTAEEFLAEISTLPHRATEQEVRDFLESAIGSSQEPPETDSTVVTLPAPSAGEMEVHTEAGGRRSTAPSSLEVRDPRGEAWPPGRALPPVDRTMPHSEQARRPESEKTELYRPRTVEPAAPPLKPARPFRASQLVYAGIVAAATIALALLWLNSSDSPEGNSSSAARSLTSLPASVGARPPSTAASATDPGKGAASVPTPDASPVGFEDPGARLSKTEEDASNETPGRNAVPSPLAGAPPPRRTAERQPPPVPNEENAAVNRPRVAASSPPPPPESPSMFYCATKEGTSYAQGTIKEKPLGFASDAAPAFRGPRTDAGRIHIDVSINPEKPREGEPFRVTARLVNEGDIDLILDKIEESAERQEGGFRPVQGRGAAKVTVGGVLEIYRFEGALAAGATYRKDLRVIDRFGDSWRTSIRIVPCD